MTIIAAFKCLTEMKLFSKYEKQCSGWTKNNAEV